MGDKVDEPKNDIGDWIPELSTDADEGAGDSRLEETRVQSSAFNPNFANRMTRNAAEKFNHHTAAKSIDMPRSTAAPKQVDFDPGLAPKSTIETVGHISSSHNRSLSSTDSSNQFRRDTQPNIPADSAAVSSAVQTSKMSVSWSSQQLQLPRQNNYQPSIHLFTEPKDTPSHKNQQPKTKTAQLQPSQESTSVNKMGNLASTLMSKHTQRSGHQRSPPKMRQQLPMFENDVSNVLQRSSQQKNNALRSHLQAQQHQEMIAAPSNYMNMHEHQHLSEFNSRSESSKSRNNLQQLSQPTQFSQNVNIQNQGTFISEGTQNNLQTSTSLRSQSSVVSNQMKQSEESHTVVPENSSGSKAPSTLTNSSDWRDQAYEQLQFVKEAHLADVMRVRNSAVELSLQSAAGKGTDKCEKMKIFDEQMVTFLQISKADFSQYSQEEVHQKMKMIMWYIKQLKDRNPHPMQQFQPLQQSARHPEMEQLQQSEGENLQANVSRKDPKNTPFAPQLSSQRGPTNLQAWPINSSLTGTGSAESSLINQARKDQQLQYGKPRSAAQCASSRQQQKGASNLQAHSTPSRIHQTSMNNPLQIGSQRTLGKRASRSLPHGSTINVSQNALNTPLEVNSSAREMVNALDSIMRSVPPGPAPSLSPLIKQQEKYQMMQAQKIKHSMQPGVTSESDSRMVAQKTSEEMSIGQVISHQKIHEQRHLVSQTRELSSHRWVPSSTSQHHVVSPHVSQPQFPLVESTGISLTKDSVTFQPTTSPVTVPPSLVPLHMSSALVNSKTDPSSHPVSLTKSKKTISKSFSPTTVVQSLILDSHAAPISSSLPKTTTQGSSEKSHVERESSAIQKSSLPLTITPGNSEQLHAEGDSHGLARSSLPSRTTLRCSNEQSRAEEESSANRPVFNRLIEMVQSLSPEELHSFAKDIEMVVHQVDWTPGTSPYGQCREYNIDNSRYHWRYDEKEGVFFPHHGDSSDTKIKRHLTAMAPDGPASPLSSCVRDDFSSHLTFNIESSPACEIKRQKAKLSDLLLQEVKEINQKLIETTLGMVHSPDAEKGIVVRFSYRAVGHSKNIMLPDLVLQVFVADDYPHSSPYALDPSPYMFRDNEEHKALWENTKSKFKKSLQMCSQPISLGKMARTWDSSARDAILELAKKQGGGCFTATYGGWEDCT